MKRRIDGEVAIGGNEIQEKLMAMFPRQPALRKAGWNTPRVGLDGRGKRRPTTRGEPFQGGRF